MNTVEFDDDSVGSGGDAKREEAVGMMAIVGGTTHY